MRHPTAPRTRRARPRRCTQADRSTAVIESSSRRYASRSAFHASDPTAHDAPSSAFTEASSRSVIASSDGSVRTPPTSSPSTSGWRRNSSPNPTDAPTTRQSNRALVASSSTRRTGSGSRRATSRIDRRAASGSALQGPAGDQLIARDARRLVELVERRGRVADVGEARAGESATARRPSRQTRRPNLR